MTPSATRDTILALKAPASLKAIALACLPLERGRLTLRFPSGETLAFGAPDHPRAAAIAIHTPRFARRLFLNGDIGFAEGYVAGDWTADDLPAALTLLADNAETLGGAFLGNPLLGVLERGRRALTRENTKSGARRNILAHYDLGNAFYAAWLDPSMTYSSALFSSGQETLEAGQRAKYQAIAASAGLAPGQDVLEIGCGWGGFAEHAARAGARLTGLTLSDAQHDYAKARLAGQELPADSRVQDYRDVEGSFDTIVSIEMIEAVGAKFRPLYFQKLARALRAQGRAALQAILIRDDLFAGYAARVDFIQRHVFPGGQLPSLHRLEKEAGAAGLRIVAERRFGMDYARTLSEWRARFLAAWPKIANQGFDQRFKRLWEFYLAYCEAGFRTGRTDVAQLVLRHAG